MVGLPIKQVLVKSWSGHDSLSMRLSYLVAPVKICISKCLSHKLINSLVIILLARVPVMFLLIVEWLHWPCHKVRWQNFVLDALFYYRLNPRKMSIGHYCDPKKGTFDDLKIGRYIYLLSRAPFEALLRSKLRWGTMYSLITITFTVENSIIATWDLLFTASNSWQTPIGIDFRSNVSGPSYVEFFLLKRQTSKSCAFLLVLSLKYFQIIVFLWDFRRQSFLDCSTFWIIFGGSFDCGTS